LLINSLNFNLCRGCNGGGYGSRSSDERLVKDNLTLFGTNYKNVCNGMLFIIASPAAETLEHTKELMVIAKNILDRLL